MAQEIKIILDLSDGVQAFLEQQDVDLYEELQQALRILKRQDAQMLSELASNALATLDGQVSGDIFKTLTQMNVANTIGELGIASPLFLERLTQLLDWPHWLVRAAAIDALGQLRWNIPDAAIRRLLELRRDPDPRMRVVREVADDALGEILSLETGIEDD